MLNGHLASYGTRQFPGGNFFEATHISIIDVEVIPEMDYNLMPFVRSLNFTCRRMDQFRSVEEILPLLRTLTVRNVLPESVLAQLLYEAQFVSDFAANQLNLMNLETGSDLTDMIQQRLVVLRVTGDSLVTTRLRGWNHATFISLLEGSVVLKEVYLASSASMMRWDRQVARQQDALLQVCARKGIELWAGEEGRETHVNQATLRLVQ